MKLRLYGLTQRDIFTVHFSYAGIKEAAKTMPYWDEDHWVAEIPDVMLIQNKELRCYVYLEESNSGITGYEISLPIIPRAKPSDYILDPANIFMGVGELIEKAYAAEILDNSAEVVQAAHDAEDALAEVIRLEATTQGAAQAVEDGLAEIELKRRQIAAIKTEADTLAAQALEKASNAENESAEMATSVDTVNRKIQELEMKLQTKFDNAFLESGLLYFEGENVVLVGPLGPFAGGGGGGGGGGSSGNNAVITVTNTSGWMSRTIASGSNCVATLNWSSLEDDIPTGDGTLSVIVSGSVRAMFNVAQGNVSVDLSKFAAVGSNVIKVNIADTYGNSRTINFSLTVVELSISSSFDSSVPYSGPISFPYTPMGNVSKTIYFILDEGTANEFIGTATTSVSNRQQSYTILQQSHGAHTLRCYFEAEINGQTVRSNELYYEIICIDPLSSEPIITSNFTTTSVTQYTPIHIDYTVYNPLSMVSDVTIAVNNEVVSTLTNVDRTSHVFDYRPVNTGTLTVTIASGEEVRAFTITVTESEIDVAAETEDLALYLTSAGRSNNESAVARATWTSGNISATMSNFNWTSDGWQHDEEGTPVLRVVGDARVTIPYKIFETDFRGTGKTIEVEFATRSVLDYDATIISSMNGGRGFSMTSQKATLKSEQSEISMQYKENEHVRLSFVVEKRSENRLIFCYVNGIMSGVVQYPNDDDFAQATPANISIGSNDCAVDIYCIRVYDNDLNRNQILDNWIADTQVIEDMVARYNRNKVYDEYGNIVISSLPGDLPYVIIEVPELPQYKGDKKTCTIRYIDPVHAEKSFVATGVQINVQGTSSAPYARKNYDTQYKSGFETNYGHIDNYALDSSVIPFNRFVYKADVASSEGANNVELVKLYCDISPFKTREMIANPKVRQGIFGFPMVVFWNNTDSGTTSFLGKYNFNLPKRAPEPYGYSGNMESWEFQNNTSDLMVYKSDYFDETMYTDPDTGETKELWRYDFEARFPSDEWVDYTKLQELQSFIVSTDRTEATGDA